MGLQSRYNINVHNAKCGYQIKVYAFFKYCPRYYFYDKMEKINMSKIRFQRYVANSCDISNCKPLEVINKYSMEDYDSFKYCSSLWWRHNDHDSVSNHQPHECLFNRLFRSKKTSKLRVTGLCVGNSPGPVNSPHEGPVTRKMFPFDDVIMWSTNHKWQEIRNSIA